jgi:hypothetical protein
VKAFRLLIGALVRLARPARGVTAAGRANFVAGQDDFTVSDVPFRDGHDQLGGTAREVVPWDYS